MNNEKNILLVKSNNYTSDKNKTVIKVIKVIMNITKIIIISNITNQLHYDKFLFFKFVKVQKTHALTVDFTTRDNVTKL